MVPRPEALGLVICERLTGFSILRPGGFLATLSVDADWVAHRRFRIHG